MKLVVVNFDWQPDWPERCPRDQESMCLVVPGECSQSWPKQYPNSLRDSNLNSIVGGCGNCGRWGLATGSRLPEACIWRALSRLWSSTCPPWSEQLYSPEPPFHNGWNLWNHEQNKPSQLNCLHQAFFHSIKKFKKVYECCCSILISLE